MLTWPGRGLALGAAVSGGLGLREDALVWEVALREVRGGRRDRKAPVQEASLLSEQRKGELSPQGEDEVIVMGLCMG